MALRIRDSVLWHWMWVWGLGMYVCGDRQCSLGPSGLEIACLTGPTVSVRFYFETRLYSEILWG